MILFIQIFCEDDSYFFIFQWNNKYISFILTLMRRIFFT